MASSSTFDSSISSTSTSSIPSVSVSVDVCSDKFSGRAEGEVSTRNLQFPMLLLTPSISNEINGGLKGQCLPLNYSLESPNTPKIEDLESSLAWTDSDNDYLIIHWVDCSDSSPDTVKSCRGIIRRQDEIVCRTFNYTPEFIGMSEKALSALSAVWDKSKIIYPAFEGTSVRLWYDQEKWHLSTFRKLDAYHSRWGCKTSYGDLFMKGLVNEMKDRSSEDTEEQTSPDECFQSYCSTLRKDRIYTFLIHSVLDNRIVTKVNDSIPRLSFTGEFDNNPKSHTRFALLAKNTSHINWPILNIPLFFDSPEDALKFVENSDPMLCQGLMVHYGVESSTFGSIKLTSKQYQALAELRGNEPSVIFRYLQLRCEMNSPGESEAGSVASRKQRFESFRNLYPERWPEFDECETILKNAINTIYQGYIKRYLKHEYIHLPQELWHVARNLHDAYLQNPQLNKISLELVQRHVNQLPAVRQNFIIRRSKASCTPSKPS
jgi:hypothetical protein